MNRRKEDKKRAPSGGEMRSSTPEPPRGWERLKWYGPGLLWLVATVGSGQVLFTPRIGSRYGLELLWAALIILVLMWVVLREIGRYTVVTGKTVLAGYRDLPGPRGWAVWLFFLPALVANVVAVAGISALIGRLLVLALPGSPALYATLIILISIVLVTTGRYRTIEQVTSIMAIILVLATITTAILVFPAPGEIASGLIPHIPEDFDLHFVLPWFGLLVAGAIGIVWFSYWVAARGYGGKIPGEEALTEEGDLALGRQGIKERTSRLRGWIRIMATAAAIGVFGGGLVSISFLILGSEVLRPEGIIPQGIGVAEDLTRLLSEIWGAAGFWIIMLGMFIALWGTVLANQDGGGRSHADATMLLVPASPRKPPGERDRQGRVTRLWRNVISDRPKLRNIYAVIITAVIPLAVFFALRDPVEILSIGGIIASSHTPIVIILTLYLNSTRLPRELRPGKVWLGIMVFAGIFYAIFAVLFFLELSGITIA